MLRWAALAICIAVSAFGALRLAHHQTGGFPLTFAAAVLAVGIIAERTRSKAELDRPPANPRAPAGSAPRKPRWTKTAAL